MHNHDRRVRYLLQNHPDAGLEMALNYVRASYADGTDLGLKPGQRRRVKHKRAHNQFGVNTARRDRKRLALRSARDRALAHWGPAAGTDDGLLKQVRDGLRARGWGISS